MAFFRKSGPPVAPVPVDPNAEQFGYVQPPGADGSFMDQYRYINRTNPNALMQLGAGMIAGDVAGGFSQAGQEMQQGADRQQRAKLALYGYNEGQRKDNLTKQWLLSQGFDEATANAAMANPDILSSLLRQTEGGGTEVFGTPIYGTDPDTGATVLGTFDKQGKFHKIDTGDFDVSSGVKTVETATEVITINARTGEIIARQSKDVAAGKEQEIIGKGTGEAKVLLKSMKAKMPGVEYVVKELEGLAHKATYTSAGKLVDAIRRETGQEPREAALARAEYINKVKVQVLPILRDTFGAAFTVAEGNSLLATLGDPDAAPAEKQATLKAFIEQKRRDIEALAIETDQSAGDGEDQEGDTATGPNGEKIIFRNGTWVPQ